MISPELVFNHKDMPDSVLSPFSTPSPSQFAESIEPEIDSHGAIEYKLHMLSPHPARLAQLTTQLQWRLAQGQGQAIYEIGVASDGTLTGLLDNEVYGSLRTLKRMARIVGAWFKVVRVIPIHGQEVAESDLTASRRVVEVHVFKKTVEKDVIKMFLVGATNSGKSSLLGKICYDVPDNGRGKARMKVLKHRHELASGRTSSIGIEVFGYNTAGASVGSFESDDSVFEYDKVDQSGRVIVSNYTNKYTYEDIVASSNRVVMTFDTPGASDKLGLLCRNLALYEPDITVAAISGNGGRWAEYLDIALRATPRVAVLLTKSDTFTSTDQLKTLLRGILLRIATFRREGDTNIDAKDEDDGERYQHLFGKMVNSPSMAIECAANEYCVPVFLVSSVSGSGISFLHEFLNGLEPRRMAAAALKDGDEEEPEDTAPIDTSAIDYDHLIHHTSKCDCTSASVSTAAEEDFTATTSQLNFFVTSVFDSGRILTGVVRSGTLLLGRTYYLGIASSPSSSQSSSSSASSSDESITSSDLSLSKRKFVKIVVRSIQKLRFPSLELREGDIGSIGIEIIDSSCSSTSRRRPFKIQKGMSVMQWPAQPTLVATGVVVEISAQSNAGQDCKLGDMVTVFNGFERAGEIVKIDSELGDERRTVHVKFLGSRREFVCEGQCAILDIGGDKISGRIFTGIQL
ncbi:hypothetical protein V1517DRAFT_312911 [Lipomyces orientalis]|uniref:Uncharacterized protein n=1 Tax=Lipomyces orientalis TaxID=1233043 RepID=A0ACC3TY16_9ASCO